jgi:hypothetical protein
MTRILVNSATDAALAESALSCFWLLSSSAVGQLPFAACRAEARNVNLRAKAGRLPVAGSRFLVLDRHQPLQLLEPESKII